MLLKSALNAPWWGFGWGLVVPAQLSVPIAEFPPGLAGFIFMQSHNLLLDFILWVGIPGGIILSLLFLAWLSVNFKAVDGLVKAIYFSLIAVVVSHAMLEYPLHYAYFLLPVAFASGAIMSGVEGRRYIPVRRMVVLPVASILFLIGAFFVRDCFVLDARYQSARLRWAGIEGPTDPHGSLFMLTQYEPFFAISESWLDRPITDAQLQTIKSVVDFYPSLKNMVLYAAALGLSGQKQLATEWLVRACNLAPTDQCKNIDRRWAPIQARHPQLSDINMPRKVSAGNVIGAHQPPP